MVEKPDESSRLDICLAETETQEIDHERRLKVARNEDKVTAAVQEVSSNNAQKNTEEEQSKMAEKCRFGGSSPSRDDHMERNTDHHQPSLLLMSNSEAADETPAVKPAAEEPQNDSLFSSGASPAACPTEAEPNTTDCRDHPVTDDPGTAASLDGNNTDLLHVNTQKENQKEDAVQPVESVQSQQLVLNTPNEQTDTKRQDRGDVKISSQTPASIQEEQRSLYQSALHQLQQQQKHKLGRKFKKKTLMKMAKLFVMSKGLESESMEDKYSNGPLLEHEDDLSTSVPLTSQSDTVQTNSITEGKNEGDRETFLSSDSTDATFSGQTAAVTSTKRKTRSTRKKKRKHKSNLSGAAETDGSTSTSSDIFLVKTEEIKHVRRVKMSKREDDVTAAIMEVSPSAAQKNTEEVQCKTAEECRFGGSSPSRDDHMERNTDHHQPPLLLMSNSEAADEENQKEDAVQPVESVQSQQLMLHPPNEQTDTKRQDRGDVILSNQTPATVVTEEQKSLYQSAFHQLQQQQKHKLGRKFKKKTLMKMAKLFVMSKELESESMEDKYSNGPLLEHEPLVLNQKDDLSTSVPLTSQSDTVQTNSVTEGKNEGDRETFLSSDSTDATFSGQTAAVTSTKRKTRSTRKKKRKPKSNLSGAAETDGSTSTSSDVCLVKTETEEIKHERRVKMARREDNITATVMEVSSNTAQKNTEEEQCKTAEECRFGGSSPSRDDHMERNTDHHQPPLLLMSNSEAAEETPAVKPAADEPQNDSLFSSGASPAACPTEAEPNTTDCSDHPVTDDPGTAASLGGNNMDLLHLNAQKENQKEDAMQPVKSVQSQQLILNTPNEKTDTKRQDRGDVKISSQTPASVQEEQRSLYQSALHQLQQQQKHKLGRKFKKKTLMKMAKLFVMSKGLESESVEDKYSNGPLLEHEPLVLNQKDDLSTSVPLTSQSDTVQTNSVPEGKNEGDRETFLSSDSTDATFSGQTAAVPLKKRKTRSTRKKKEKQKSNLSGAAETDGSTSTSSNVCLVKTETEEIKHVRRVKMVRREDDVTAAIMEVSPSTDQKNTEEEQSKTAEECSFSGSSPSRDDHMERNTDHHQPSLLLMSNSEAAEETPAVKPAADAPQNDSLFSSGASPAACREAELNTTDCRDHPVTDDPGTAASLDGNNINLFHLNAQKENQKEDAVQPVESVQSQQLILNTPNEQTVTERQERGDVILTNETLTSTVVTVEQKNLYRSVVHQLQQQQKHKLGRKFKKKTLMKMAKLFVMSKELESESVEDKYSNGPLLEHEALVLNQKDDLSTSVPLTSQSDTVQTNSVTEGKNEGDRETFLSSDSTDATFSGQTAAVPLKKRKTRSTRKKKEKEKSNLSGAAETDGSTSTSSNVCLVKTETEEIKHERRVKMARREDDVTAAIMEVSPSTAQRNTEEEQSKTAEECSFGGSSPSRDDRMERNTDHHQPSLLLMSNSEAAEETPPASLDGSNMDLLLVNTQKENQKGDTVQLVESVQSQQLILHPPNEQPDTKRQDRGDVILSNETPVTVVTEEQRSLYQSALHQLQQQQKHKLGRKFKKKTLMKMAKLFVMSKGLESESMEDKYSNGPSAEHEPLVLNQKDDLSISVPLTSQSDTVQTNSVTEGKNEGDRETFLSSDSTDATFSGQTAAEKRKTRSTRKKKRKLKSNLSGAAETDGSTSTNVPEKSDVATEMLLDSRPVTATKDKENLGKMSSVTLEEDTKITCEEDTKITCDISEMSKKKPRKRRRKHSARALKKRNEQNQTSTEFNNVGTQEVSEGVIVSCDEPLLALSSSIQDTVCSGVDFNAVKQEQDKSGTPGLTSGALPLFQGEISWVESVPSAAPAIKSKTKGKRRKKTTGWAVKKKLKSPQINSHYSDSVDVEMSSFSLKSSPCDSASVDEKIKLKLKDKNDDIKQKNSEQTLTADTNIKHSSKLTHYRPCRHELKQQKPLKCSFCGRSFRHITAFTVHRRIHTGEKPYSCPTCGKRFSQLSQLNVHSNIHRKPPAVCCPCCAETFKSKDELILHFHAHMKNTESSKTTGEGAKNQQAADCLDSPVTSNHMKFLRCSVCFKEFLNQATFKMHRRTHGGKPFSCSVCGKSFCKSSRLSSHEKTHWPVKPYACSVCGEGFFKLQELKQHSQIHSFSFDKGEKAFSSFDKLHSHQGFEGKQDAALGNQRDVDGFLVSQGAAGQIVTPTYFKCPICKQLHCYWCQYILHLQTHTHSTIYTCERCRQQYDQTAGMRRHCMVCCKRSGEEKACRSSLTDIWKEPEAQESQVLELHLDHQSAALEEDQTGEMLTLPQVETGDKDVTITQAAPASPSSSSLSVMDDCDFSPAPSPSSRFSPAPNQESRQPSRFHLQSLIRRHCGRYSCAHCGKSFSQWNKLWLHQRLHRQTGRSFSCSRCDLEFRFLGSYMDHLREHAARSPHACAVCPGAFASKQNLSTHMTECHKQCDFMKCSTCGKNFSTLRNLKQHKLLHKGASSHFCLPCNVSLSSHSALKTHLKTHMARVKVPQPTGPVEPLLFPYQCTKCTAKFSSADLLQAHQICHFTAGKRMESLSESVTSCIPSRATQDAQRVVSESSQRKRRLPVSNKKHLFRYPHPDRLYVVPIISSEPPIVISDAEEERPEIQILSSSITTSASNAASDLPRRQPGASISNLPQSSGVDEHRAGSSAHDSCKDLSGISGCESEAAEPPLMFAEEEFVEDVHSCAICMETFTEISKLHKHYIEHARGT